MSGLTTSEKGILRGDIFVWMIFILLCGISIIEVYSASSAKSYSSGNYLKPVLEHGAYVVAGFFMAWVVHLIPHRHFKFLSVVGLHFVAYPLLVMVLFTRKINGASRWLEVGGITIQPSEIAKIALVGFVAWVLASFRDKRGVTETAFKVASVEIMATVCLIVFENASTAGIIFLAMVGMMFFAQAPRKYMAWVYAAFLAGIITIVAMSTLIPQNTLNKLSADEDHVLHRLPVWVSRIRGYERTDNPNDFVVHDKNRQWAHARIAVATCGVTGKGPGNSVQRDYLPQAYSDFIYSIIIEEGGIAFGIFVMSLYLLLMWRAMRIAEDCNTRFPAYLVMGLALMMVLQAMVNMAVAVGAFPVTGQPLPLVSKGGTATFINCAYMGIILSVSRYARRMRAKRQEQAQVQLAAKPVEVLAMQTTDIENG